MNVDNLFVSLWNLSFCAQTSLAEEEATLLSDGLSIQQTEYPEFSRRNVCCKKKTFFLLFEGCFEMNSSYIHVLLLIRNLMSEIMRMVHSLD